MAPAPSKEITVAEQWRSFCNTLSKEWKDVPWKVWKPPSQVWREMPSFVVAEWGYRATNLIALYHACVTGRKKTWIAAWVCGTANDIFFMFMPFCDNFWQGQASVMVTPRLPLYIVEMYASVMYYAPVAASLFSRSMGLNPYAQACLTGLLCHLYYGVYDINGPRYLWWTWHDGDPAISERNCNAPYGSSMWILTYCGLQSFLNSWILRGKGARLTGKTPEPQPRTPRFEPRCRQAPSPLVPMMCPPPRRSLPWPPSSRLVSSRDCKACSDGSR